MSCNKQYQKSILNTFSNQSQDLQSNQSIEFDNISIDTGCSIKFCAGSSTATLTKPGIYLISASATIMNPKLDKCAATMEIYKNGEPADGTPASLMPVPEGVSTLSTMKLVQVLPSCCSVDNTTNISVVNTGVPVEYSEAELIIIKLC